MPRYRLTDPDTKRYLTLAPGTTQSEAAGWARFSGWTLSEAGEAARRSLAADLDAGHARRTQYHAEPVR